MPRHQLQKVLELQLTSCAFTWAPQVPAATFRVLDANGMPQALTTEELFGGKKVRCRRRGALHRAAGTALSGAVCTSVAASCASTVASCRTHTHTRAHTAAPGALDRATFVFLQVLLFAVPGAFTPTCR